MASSCPGSQSSQQVLGVGIDLVIDMVYSGSLHEQSPLKVSLLIRIPGRPLDDLNDSRSGMIGNGDERFPSRESCAPSRPKVLLDVRSRLSVTIK
jgi:hypothetical protein